MINKEHRRPCLLVLVVLYLVLLSGCTGSGSATSHPGGLQVVPGVDLVHKTIILGILSPSTGLVAEGAGIPLANGVKAYFDGINAQGGIDGFKIKFLEEDTQYDPQIEVQAYDQVHTHVLMIADSLGTLTTFAIKDQATADHMLISAATSSSALAREKYLVMVGTPYRLHVENAFDYVVNKLGVHHPATGIIFQNDEYGQDGLNGYQGAVRMYQLHDVADVTYAVTDTAFTTQVAQLKASGAHYVFMNTLPTATAAIIGTAAKLGYFPQWILQNSAFSVQLLTIPALRPLLSRAWVSEQGAVWGDQQMPGMVRMLKDVASYYPQQKPDGYFEFGYVESMVTGAILKRALANGDLTRNGLFRAFESLKSVDLGGLYPPVTYGSSPNQRVPNRSSIIYQVDAAIPAGLKPLTPYFTGVAARQSQF